MFSDLLTGLGSANQWRQFDDHAYLHDGRVRERPVFHELLHAEGRRVVPLHVEVRHPRLVALHLLHELGHLPLGGDQRPI